MKVRIVDLVVGGRVRARAIMVQQKTAFSGRYPLSTQQGHKVTVRAHEIGLVSRHRARSNATLATVTIVTTRRRSEADA